MRTRNAGYTASTQGASCSPTAAVRARMSGLILPLAFASALVVALMLAMSLVGCSSSGAAGGSAYGEAQGITVSASNEVKVIPDKARLSVSVVTEAKEAKDCQSKNAETVNAVIAALQGLGVEETSIQTSYSDLSPRYGQISDKSTSSDKDEKEVAAYDEWTITGYEMTTSLSISDLEIDNVGAAVQVCVAAGANGADGIEYYASNYDEVYNAALGRALETARGKADGIATASSVKVGKVLNVVEGYQDTSSRYTAANMSFDEAATGDAGAVAKTMPGQIGIIAQVTVTYAIA